MPHALASALTFALIPAGVALVGAVIAAFRTPSPRIRTYVEHFAAGVVAAVAAAELLPAALKGRSAIAIAIGFGLGTIAMLLIAHFSERAIEQGGKPERDHAGQPRGQRNASGDRDVLCRLHDPHRHRRRQLTRASLQCQD